MISPEIINLKTDFNKKLDKTNYKTQFLPDCLLDISKLQNLFFRNQNIKTQYLIDLVHNLILKYYFTKQNSFNLSSVILKEKYGYLYNYYINYLTENNILILTKKHKAGKNARIYKINESVLKNKITRFKNQNKTLIKKYKNDVLSIDKQDFSKNKIDYWIKKKLVSDLFYVEIDYAKSIFFLESTLQDNDIYQRNRYSVESINDKHIFYHFDNFGRMHTNFTILKSFLRKNCLLINGESTCEIDIKNSQPLFLSKLIDLYNVDFIDEDELKFFKYLTKSGKFYDYFIKKSNDEERKTIKSSVYKVFFGKNYPNKFDRIFEEKFPTIYKFIKYFKKVNGGYKTLSYSLQNLESDFIYNKVIKEIFQKNPDINILTVHDSIISPVSHGDFVKDIFHKHLNIEFGTNTTDCKNIDFDIYSYA
jgi:hypothetical protein